MESFAESTRPQHFDSGEDSSPIFAAPAPYANGDIFFSVHPVDETLSPPSMGGYSAFSPEQNGGEIDGIFGSSDGTILPEMLPESGFALREWRRQNAIRMAEKEMLRQIKEEAEEYKTGFYSKRKVACETHRTANREKEKLFLETREKFHAEAEKNYWKATAELIPHEVSTIEKRGRNKNGKKPSIVVIQSPKPGKPTDLSRMRQILGKLKHNPPSHMNPEPKKDANAGNAPSKPAAVVEAARAPVAVA